MDRIRDDLDENGKQDVGGICNQYGSQDTGFGSFGLCGVFIICVLYGSLCLTAIDLILIICGKLYNHILHHSVHFRLCH